MLEIIKPRKSLFCDADLIKFGFDTWKLDPRIIYTIIRLPGPRIWQKRTEISQNGPKTVITKNKTSTIYEIAIFPKRLPFFQL